MKSNFYHSSMNSSPSLHFQFNNIPGFPSQFQVPDFSYHFQVPYFQSSQKIMFQSISIKNQTKTKTKTKTEIKKTQEINYPSVTNHQFSMSNSPKSFISSLVIDGPNLTLSPNTVCDMDLLNQAYQLFSDNYLVKIVFPEFYSKSSFVNTRQRKHISIVNSYVFRQLYNQKAIFLVPNGEYDDTYSIKLAHETNGYILSNDHYSDCRIVSKDWINSHRIGFSISPNLNRSLQGSNYIFRPSSIPS